MASRFWQNLLATYKIEDVKGDGNCFYRAIALAVYNDEEMYRTVRKEVLTFIISNYKEYRGFFNEGELYLHCKDRTYADEQIVHAASRVYQCNIAVRQPPEIVPIVHPPTGHFLRTIHLLLEEEHYQLLVQKNVKKVVENRRARVLDEQDQRRKEGRNDDSFYRAIATAYYNDESSYIKVRADVIGFIFANLVDRFAKVFTAAELYAHSQDGTNADSRIVDATSKAYCVNIVVALPPPIGRIVYPPGGEFTRTISLSLVGESYYLLPEECAAAVVEDQRYDEDKVAAQEEQAEQEKEKDTGIPTERPSGPQTVTVRMYDEHAQCYNEFQVDVVDLGSSTQEPALDSRGINEMVEQLEIAKDIEMYDDTSSRDSDDSMRKSRQQIREKPATVSNNNGKEGSEENNDTGIRGNLLDDIDWTSRGAYLKKCSVVLTRIDEVDRDAERSPKPKRKARKRKGRNTARNGPQARKPARSDDQFDVQTINNNDSAVENTANGTDKKPHKCPTCGRGFALKGDMTEHIETHNANNTYICTVCKKGFKTKKGLNRHAKTHTDEKPYKCTICDHRSRTSSNLAVHMWTHRKGPKPHKCPSCPQDFWRKSHLNEHVKTHNPNNSYECSVCQKVLSSKQGLSIHMKIHTGKKDHVCSTCGYRCYTSWNLTTHMRTHRRDG